MNTETAIHLVWLTKADRNIKKWGIQSMKDVCLAMQEELGELTQAILQFHHEGTPIERVSKELDDLAALCYQMILSIQREVCRQ